MNETSPLDSQLWLGVMIGNSRLHYGQFSDTTLLNVWDSAHLRSDPQRIPNVSEASIPIILASVVPEQTALWVNHPNVKIITLEQLSLKGIYPTLGIDRALAVLGGGILFGWPILVIDAGTALTFTGGDRDQCLVGGAILPGLGLQFSALAQKTAALPQINFPQYLPQRWARDTPGAIQSGIIYAILAGIRDFVATWLQDFPQSHIIITGGDAQILLKLLQLQYSELASKIIADPHLIFGGMSAVRQKIEFKSRSYNLVAKILE